MPYSTSHKFIFIHIPKCAGTSITKTLAAACGGLAFRGPASLPQHAAYGCFWLQHAWASSLRDVVGKEVWFSSFKFAFVRNPWDRVVSLFNYFTFRFPKYPRFWIGTPKWYYFAHPEHSSKQILRWVQHERTRRKYATYQKSTSPEKCFRNWVTEYFSSADKCFDHGIPAVRYVTDDKGSILVDYVGRYETIDDDFAYITKRIGISVPLAAHNATPRSGFAGFSDRESYRRYYDEHSARIIADYFAEDIRRWDYAF